MECLHEAAPSLTFPVICHVKEKDQAVLADHGKKAKFLSNFLHGIRRDTTFPLVLWQLLILITEKGWCGKAVDTVLEKRTEN